MFKKDILKFNAYGFLTYTEKIKKEDNITINLIYAEGENSYNYVVKYGYLSKKNLDYCVNNLLEDNNNYDKFTPIADLVQSICPSANFYENPEDGR